MPSLVDVVQEFTIRGLPTVLPRVVVWVDPADGLGDLAVELLVQRPATAAAPAIRLATVEVPVEFTRPGQVRTPILTVERLALSGPGTIEVRLAAGAAVSMVLRYRVRARTPGEN